MALDDMPRCAHLGSHNDQTRGAYTLKCQDSGTSAMGAGGRIADALLSQSIQVASYSMGGNVIWSQGVSVRREAVAGVGELSSLTDYEFGRETVRNITSVQHANVYANAYTELFFDSIETYQHMSRMLKSAELKTKYEVFFPGLNQQLKQVAQVVVQQEGRQAERDLFFEAVLYVFEDNEAVIKMIRKGRVPTMRHVSRIHRVALDWLFDRINLVSKIQIRYVDTKHQLADILTKGNYVTNGTIFFICSTSAVSAPLAALRIPAW